MATFAGGQPAGLQPGGMDELEAVLDELRRDLTSLEAEYRAAYGQMPVPGSEAEPEVDTA